MFVVGGESLIDLISEPVGADGAIRLVAHQGGSPYNCAIALANGLLFLGGGLRTLGTSNQAVAALLIALFPRFPATSADNRCHLQAFRHLYVLASGAAYHLYVFAA